MKSAYTMKSKVVRYPGMDAWHFAYIDKKVSEEIKTGQKKMPRKGWGSVRVKATIGKTSWDTSIFPDSKEGTFLLPLKAAVRKKEGIFDGDVIKLTIRII